MEKTISVNLAGLVFQIEENAYELLSDYLERLKQRFGDESERAEILGDIEARIAEMFSDRTRDSKQVITLTDVQEVIDTLGAPEQIASDEEADGTYESSSGGSSSSEGTFAKQLFRDPDNQIIGGVCGGIAAYFGIGDAIWLRLLFVALTIFGVGSPILIYLILWIIIPEAKTTSQKLLMRGKPVTVDNIEKSVRSEIRNFEDRIGKKKRKPGEMSRAERVLGDVVGALLQLLRLALKFVFGFAWAILIGLVFILLSSLLLALFAFVVPFFPEINAFFFSSKILGVLFTTGIFTFIGLPLIFLLFLAIRSILNSKVPVRQVGLVATILWFFGLLMLAGSTLGTALDFAERDKVRAEVTIDQPYNDTLLLGTLNTDKPLIIIEPDYTFSEARVEISNVEQMDSFFFPSKLQIERSPDDDFHLYSVRAASGPGETRIQERIDGIIHRWEQNGNELNLSDHFGIDRETPWRKQEFDWILAVPVGSAISLEGSITERLTQATRAGSTSLKTIRSGKTLEMTTAGLICQDCDPEQVNERSDFNGNLELGEVELDGRFDGIIRSGESFSLNFSDPEDAELVEVEMDGEAIEISQKEAFFGNKRIDIEIVVPDLESLTINGASEIEAEGLQGEELKITVNGASRLDMPNLEYNTLEITVNGASKLAMSGQVRDVVLEVHGAGKYLAAGLDCSTLEIDMSGAAKAEVSVIERIEGRLSGAANIEYSGEPNIEVRKSGAAKVRQAD